MSSKRSYILDKISLLVWFYCATVTVIYVDRGKFKLGKLKI